MQDAALDVVSAVPAGLVDAGVLVSPDTEFTSNTVRLGAGRVPFPAAPVGVPQDQQR